MRDNKEEDAKLGCGGFLFVVFLLVILIIEAVPFTLKQANNTIDVTGCYQEEKVKFNVCHLAWKFINNNASELYKKDVVLQTLSRQAYDNNLDCHHDNSSIQCQAIALRVEQLNGFSSSYVTNTIAAIYANKIKDQNQAITDNIESNKAEQEKMKVESYINSLIKN